MCVSVQQLGDPCQTDHECSSKVDNSVCNSNKCVCGSNYYDNNEDIAAGSCLLSKAIEHVVFYILAAPLENGL